MRRTLTLLFALLCSLAAHPLAAQVPADTTSLAQALAAVLADSVLAYPDKKPRVWDHAGTTLDSAVARIVTRDSRLNFRERGSRLSLHVTVALASVGADSARVLVRVRQQYALTAGLNFYSEGTEFVFSRTPAGWRYVSRMVIDHADGGTVRG